MFPLGGILENNSLGDVTCRANGLRNDIPSDKYPAERFSENKTFAESIPNHTLGKRIIKEEENSLARHVEQN